MKIWDRASWLDTALHTLVKEIMSAKSVAKDSLRRMTSTNTPTATHTDERPHECHECGKTCSQKSNLNRHTRTHTGERPHECEEGGRRFSVKATLNQHIFRHSGLRELKCDVCGKCFKTKQDIAQHMKVHFWGVVLWCSAAVCGPGIGRNRTREVQLLCQWKRR